MFAYWQNLPIINNIHLNFTKAARSGFLIIQEPFDKYLKLKLLQHI